MNDNVVRLRPPSPRPGRISAVVRIDAKVSLGKLLGALAGGGSPCSTMRVLGIS